jgi:hypothetical protein
MNGAGRCWVTRIGTPIRFGSAWNSTPSAWIPPVEAPIASTSIGSLGIARSSGWAPAARRSRAGGARGVAERLELAEQDFGEAAVEAAGAGLGQRVGGAQSASAATVFSAPSSASEETIITLAPPPPR